MQQQANMTYMSTVHTFIYTSAILVLNREYMEKCVNIYVCDSYPAGFRLNLFECCLVRSIPFSSVCVTLCWFT